MDNLQEKQAFYKDTEYGSFSMRKFGNISNLHVVIASNKFTTPISSTTKIDISLPEEFIPKNGNEYFTIITPKNNKHMLYKISNVGEIEIIPISISGTNVSSSDFVGTGVYYRIVYEGK